VTVDKAPPVSIITAAYNGAPYLEETIESVLSQDYPLIEYLVLDDGSTDETPEIIARYGDRVRSRRHENIGESNTVNKGFALAQGELIGVVSADDPLLPGIVTAMVEQFDRNPDVLVIYPDWDMIDDKGDLIQHITTYDYSYRDMVRWHHCVPGPGTFFRRAIVTELGGRDPAFRYAADLDFWLRAGLLGPFKRLPKTLARYRWHAGSTTLGQQGKAMAREHIHMTEKLFARQDLPPEIRRIRREAYSSAHWIAGVVVGDNNLKLRRSHYRRALLLAPHKYLCEYRKTRLTPAILPTLVPARLLSAVRRFANVGARLKRVRQKVHRV
jgi:glycosyltransferase involved in cell wall biosynthesis